MTDTGVLTNSEKQDAVIRRIETIGEATAHLTGTTRQAIPVEFSTRFTDAGLVSHVSRGVSETFR